MKTYTETDQQLHYLSQVIAKANRTYVAAKDDDSHTNLYFDPLGDRLTGRWIEVPGGKLLLTLNLPTQTFELVDKRSKVVGSVATLQRRRVEVERELADVFVTQGLPVEGLLADMHYAIPEYAFAGQEIGQLAPEGLRTWEEYRALANQAALLLLGHAQLWEEIRIWPHHFDTGIYLKVKEDLGIGFGLAMEDDMIGAPYFYLSAYPEGRSIEYQDLPAGKHWKWELNENWKGAVLPLPQLEPYPPAERLDMLAPYLRQVYGWMMGQ
ncbi:hypothetical protein QWY85_10810 [Neolewinella lacunae]|uniref:Uncharacterized protein n=1 Tax=Neolewinella lacunae TaxID=1517758 RepID=A0A923PLG3_9BACT|nr:hypothetical protein [Neolewinella lacunae]MBC6993393.1 hypothetical protein [Neolewinella lacunae]MDN3635149.1 hypothetical protein [Neolewinella lacunae]